MYHIANNNGDLYAHDIRDKETAELKLADIIAKIGEERAEQEEIEIISDEED